MPITEHLMARGMSPGLAGSVSGVVTTPMVATGTNQATAALIPGGFSYFGTVASGTGGQLPLVSGGSVVVANGGANALLVYGQSGESIGTGSANAGFSIAAGKSAIFFKSTPTLWYPNLSA